MDDWQPTKSTTPFDRPDADIIIRSVDKKEYKILKCYLMHASPIFKDMFSLPQPAEIQSDDVSPDGLPVLTLADDGRALGFLFGYCYPPAVQFFLKPRTVQDFAITCRLARKYVMDNVEIVIKEQLEDIQLISTDPLRSFALAIHLGFDNVAKISAHSLMKSPTNYPYIDELKLISGAQLYKLQEFYDSRISSAVAVATGPYYDWIPRTSDRFFVWYNCTKCPEQAAGYVGTRIFVASGKRREASKWWMDYMDEAILELREKPIGSTVAGEKLVRRALKAANSCPRCCERAEGDMEDFTTLFSAKVDMAISAVVLDTGV